MFFFRKITRNLSNKQLKVIVLIKDILKITKKNYKNMGPKFGKYGQKYFSDMV